MIVSRMWLQIEIGHFHGFFVPSKGELKAYLFLVDGGFVYPNSAGDR